MHILFLSHYFPPEVNAPALRTFERYREWCRRGARVSTSPHPFWHRCSRDDRLSGRRP